MLRRYVREYANDKRNIYVQIAKESPRLLDDCAARIARIDQVVKAYERYEIIADDAIRAILEA